MTPGLAVRSLPTAALVAALAGCGSRNIDGADGIGGGSPVGGNGSTGGSGGTAGGSVIIDRDGGVCLAAPYVGEVAPVDLFFMVDKSASMGCPVGAAGMFCTSPPNPPPPVTRWTSMQDALAAFAMSPESAGIGAGIAFFPLLSGNTLICSAAAYAIPVAEIATLPGAARALSTAINAQMPIGNTPTVPALSGAISYAKSYAAGHPGRAVAVLFATDGEPTQCPLENNSIAGAVQVAEAAALGSPSIKTYVLGVGPNLVNLNQIAAAGGTGQAYLVESGGSRDLINALSLIRSRALTCDYAPPVTGQPLAVNAVNVKTRIGPHAMEILIPRVDGRPSCGTSGGWYYDDNAAPTRITLCPATCDPLLATPSSAVTLLVGCTSVGLPPN